MTGNLFLRTSIVFLFIGMGLGTYMGATHDFIQAPTHAHINLVGGVWMFLAGLFYNAHPNLPRRAILIHYCLAVLGFVVFVPGIWGAQIQAPWFEPVVMAGTLLTLAQMLYFAVMIFIGTGKPKATAAE